jgi:hypothetical protein
LSLTWLADRCHKKLEKKVLHLADHIITVSPGMTGEFKLMGINNITTITNGYDEESRNTAVHTENKFIMLHLGSMPRSRDPIALWQVLSSLIKENERFASQLEIRLIGKADISVLDSIKNSGLQKYVVQFPFVPHHETLDQLTAASVLLLCINDTPNARGILTNKFFEYLPAQRHILAIGPVDGDAAFILDETRAGKIFGYNDSIGLKGYVLSLFELYSQHHLDMKNQHIDKYSRKNLTKELTELLNSVIT